MHCPRCKNPVGPLADPEGIITCPGCGSRLMTRAAALRSQGGAKKAEDTAPSATMPPTPATEVAPKPPAVAPAPPDVPPPPPAVAPPPPTAPAPVAAALDPPTAPATGGTRAPEEEPLRGRRTAPAAGRKDGVTLELVLQEVRAVREAQQRILESLADLRGSLGGGSLPLPGPAFDEEGVTSLSPIRDSRPRSIVLVDDDPQTRAEAVAELQRANVPVRAFDDGNAALAGIAEEKPDVIALELGLDGEMGGRDLVNMIKATMEWVDIPIILWTREAVGSQREAQQIHGADEVVPKAGGPAGLVARVITIFRRS